MVSSFAKKSLRVLFRLDPVANCMLFLFLYVISWAQMCHCGPSKKFLAGFLIGTLLGKYE